MLARHYGTPVPQGYYRTLASHPGAFQFKRGRAGRTLSFMRAYADAAGVGGHVSDLMKVLGPREGPVQGTFRIPVVLGLFSDTQGQPPYGADTVETAYFGSGPGTVTAYYSEVSGGKVTLTGDVMGWIRSDSSQASATGGDSGLGGSSTPAFIMNLLSKIQGVDWGKYDNDGPDGIPNSGDDDGFVDALAVLHPTSGAECGGADTKDRIWSHKWSLSDATGRYFTTTTPSANGGFIKIDDYFIQPIYGCNGRALNPIGVFTHETGHAFGLPDLYDTGAGGDQGDGDWDLMATGAWGCDNATPSQPCQMGAWSKSMLGWVDVAPLPSGTDVGTLQLPPVETSHKVYRADAGDGSGDYYLLENRERLGFDGRIPGQGLLIWQIDPSWIASHWAANDVNGGSHLGVWVREADGNSDLTRPGGNRGDAGDPFPYVNGTQVNRVFHASSNPASISHLGTPTGVTVLDITRAGTNVQFHLLTRFTSITVRTEGDNGNGGLLTVNGAPVTGNDQTFRAAPFVIQRLEAAGGDTISPGVREPFVGWKDDPSAPRIRALPMPLVDSTFVAEYAGKQVHLAVESTGGLNGVSPGHFTSDPPSDDLWFAPGTDAQVTAVANTGFSFVQWTGALGGQGNPAHITVAAPTQAGAVFKLIYAVPTSTYEIQAAAPPASVQLRVDNGTAPVVWKLVDGTLPAGLTLDSDGTFSGGALDLGTFPLKVSAVDARGLSAVGLVTVTVTKPLFSVDQIASPFLKTTQTLTDLEKTFLDHQGNQNGVYDLGDFRAWVLDNPDLPTTAQGGSR
jgi:M6 family metalloprotease-like protein